MNTGPNCPLFNDARLPSAAAAWARVTGRERGRESQKRIEEESATRSMEEEEEMDKVAAASSDEMSSVALQLPKEQSYLSKCYK